MSAECINAAFAAGTAYVVICSNAVTVQDIMDIADADCIMPPKVTNSILTTLIMDRHRVLNRKYWTKLSPNCNLPPISQALAVLVIACIMIHEKCIK